MIFVFFHDGVNGRVVDFLLPRNIFHGHAMDGYEIDEVDSFLVVESYLLPRLHTPHKLFLMPRMPMNCIRTSIAAIILFSGLISNHIIDIDVEKDGIQEGKYTTIPLTHDNEKLSEYIYKLFSVTNCPFATKSSRPNSNSPYKIWSRFL